MTDEMHYKVLRIIESNPEITQRELASELDVSLGKINYCLKALIKKGLIKANNFKNNKHKLAYFYILTPKGLEQKAVITSQFLKRKMQEYEDLKIEIEQMQKEINQHNGE